MVRQRAPPREHTAAHCTSPSPRALPDLRDLAHCRLKVTDDDEWVLARVEQHWAGKVHLMRQRAPKGIALIGIPGTGKIGRASCRERV